MLSCLGAGSLRCGAAAVGREDKTFPLDLQTSVGLRGGGNPKRECPPGRRGF